MKYGAELIAQLEAENVRLQAAREDRAQRVAAWQTDEDDCFLSERVEARTISTNRAKIDLLRRGGLAWFQEYVTTDGEPVEARWCDTRYGCRLRVVFPGGRVVWTSAETPRGLARLGLRKVWAQRPAWFAFRSSASGLMGVYSGAYVLFPSDTNYATGEPAPAAPVRIVEGEEAPQE